MDSIFIYAQIAGFVAMCFSITAWQMKTQERILLCSIPGSFFWCLQFMLLGAYNAAFFSFLCMFKDGALAKAAAPYKKYIVGAFVGCNLIVLIFFYHTLFDFLPFFVCLFVNIPLLFQNNRYWVARGNVCGQICWIVFNAYSGAMVGVFCASLVITSSIIGMARHEKWNVSKCYKSFLPSIGRSLFSFNTPQTYP